MVKGIHHVALRVEDFAKAMRFYRDALGLKELRAWGEGDGRAAMLDTGDGIIELFAGGKGASEGSYFHLALRSDDVDGDYAKALAAGATVKQAPAEVNVPVTSGAPMRVRIAFVFAPTGEIVEFYHEF
ncbi:MAG: VOC family protein [Planctomycetes bacterium]|nr:VOC family protein [Planctomycetota bacterium]